MTRTGALLFGAALLLLVPAARTAPLDKEGCAKLKVEQAALEQAGTRASMIKGPEWAKTNLAPEKLEQIRRYIEVEEQLLFRCHGRPLVNLPQDPDPAAFEGEAKEGTKAPVAKAVKAPKDKKKSVATKKDAAAPADPAATAETKAEAPVKKAKSKVNSQVKDAKEGAEKPVVAKAVKSKDKQRANDAYRPPSSIEPGSNPFAK